MGFSKAKKAGLGYIIGNIVLKGVVFLTLPIFSRLLMPSDFGIYNNYLAYEGILSSIIGLGLYSSVKKAYYDFKKDFNSYFSSILSLIFIVYIALILSSAVFMDFFVQFTGFDFYIIILLISHSFGSAIIQIFGSKLNSEFKYKEYIFISALNSIINIGLSIALIFILENRAVARIIGSAFPFIIIGLFLLVFSYIKGKSFFNKKFWKYGLIMGLPLIPHVVSQYILNQSDRLMISNMIGDTESGIYSFCYNICTILFIVYSSIDASWTPRTYEQFENRHADIVVNSSKRLVYFSLTLYIGFICIAPDVYKIMGVEEYWDGINIIVPLSLSMFFYFLYYLPVNLEYYYKKTLFVSLGTILAAALNIILNYFLIPIYGYMAAAYTTLISYFVMFFAHCLIAIKFGFLKVYNIKNIIFVVFLALTFSIIVICASFNYIADYVIRYLLVLLTIIFMIVYFKNDYINVFKRKGNNQ